MKYLALIAILATPAYAVSPKPNNEPLYQCRDLYYHGINGTTTESMMAFAACVSKMRGEVFHQREREIWEFIEANPRYRVPGQSLNKCFGRPKERALDRFETKSDGSTMAYYKDKIVECY
jgi:hypothetical protein